MTTEERILEEFMLKVPYEAVMKIVEKVFKKEEKQDKKKKRIEFENYYKEKLKFK